MPVDHLRDGTPVAAILDHVVVMRPSFPARTISEFIAYAKANPGKISLAPHGTGSIISEANIKF
jgi:tripartite-type tricarboxylate transporter receptor subunit TctC